MVVDQEDSGHPESPPAPEPVETVQPPKEWSQLHAASWWWYWAKHSKAWNEGRNPSNHNKMFASIHDTSWYYIIMTLWSLKRGREARRLRRAVFLVPKNTTVVPFTPKAGIRKCIMGALIVSTCRPLIFGTSNNSCLMKIEWPGCLEWSGYDGDSDGLFKGVSKGSPRRHRVNMAKRGVPGSVEALVCRASLHGSWVDMR